MVGSFQFAARCRAVTGRTKSSHANRHAAAGGQPVPAVPTDAPWSASVTSPLVIGWLNMG
jgi:hypothetical protein